MTAEETATKTEETAVASATEEAPAKKAATAKVSTRKLSAEELIRSFEEGQIKSDLPDIYVGDTVKVGVRIREGNKERVPALRGCGDRQAPRRHARNHHRAPDLPGHRR